MGPAVVKSKGEFCTMAVPLHVRSLLPRNRKLTAISTKPTVGDMLCQHNSRDAPTAVVGDDDDLRLTDVQKRDANHIFAFSISILCNFMAFHTESNITNTRSSRNSRCFSLLRLIAPNAQGSVIGVMKPVGGVSTSSTGLRLHHKFRRLFLFMFQCSHWHIDLRADGHFLRWV